MLRFSSSGTNPTLDLQFENFTGMPLLTSERSCPIKRGHWLPRRETRVRPPPVGPQMRGERSNCRRI
ncbi:hypothetical protein Bca52824_084220 [Brassica carinata]|uniref:Uncharacterized protein n=1 Tax=Brassica carinata TaxID=52824 RepID=A0A8X7TUD1_BRACI|nr:hypothetical protein Bca52824_084220 [Brassica carinata]